MLLSFKLRDEEVGAGGRFLNSYDEGSLRMMLSKHPELQIHSVWVSDDARPQQAGEQWLNALLVRAPQLRDSLT
jgi:hypothetical protein